MAVAGATGAVGNMMVTLLEERNFPVNRLVLLASTRSAGSFMAFQGEEVQVEVLTEESFEGVDVAFFSAGATVSQSFAPVATLTGCIVIDNTSAFRMEPDVPLVVPEVNPHAIVHYEDRGLIANPNCSTIQLVVALKPIHDVARIQRIVVSTYQSVSGTGRQAIQELSDQTTAILNFQEIKKEVYPHQIAFNCIPQIDAFLENGYTKEEMKMVNETRKILEDDSIRIAATTVRVPVFYGHSESVNIETERKISPEEVREILSEAPGVVIADKPAESSYPMAITAAGTDATYVGRIREDFSIENGINLWIVADNIRKGAALNAIQIAEILINKYI